MIDNVFWVDDKKDAERYRFLFKEIGYINSNYGVSYFTGSDFLLATSGEELNDIIDLAMKATNDK